MANQLKQKYAKAEEWGTIALKAYESQVRVKDTNYVILLVEQFRTCYYADKYPQSMYYLRLDSAWIVKHLGIQNDYYGYFCAHAGLVHQKLGQFELAEQQLKEAKTVRGQVLGTSHPNYANTCDNLINFYQNMGNYTQAEVLHLQSKEIREKVLGRQDPGYACSCNNMVSVYQDMGRYNLSEELYTEAKAIYKKNFWYGQSKLCQCIRKFSFSAYPKR